MHLPFARLYFESTHEPKRTDLAVQQAPSKAESLQSDQTCRKASHQSRPHITLYSLGEVLCDQERKSPQFKLDGAELALPKEKTSPGGVYDMDHAVCEETVS
jgi:hypothetical protein